jgi:pimeloyl-ACP methyl ester carboxylesterase
LDRFGGLLVLLFLMTLIILLVYSFTSWKKGIIEELRQRSHIISTRNGPIEYVFFGNGPVLLAIHGGPGGYDQGEFILWEWAKKGYSVLSYSRPGYLRTPLSSGRTIKEQTDATIALLDALKIDQVIVVAASAGGPIAIELCIRYPERVRALVMLCAVSMRYIPRQSQTNSMIERILTFDTIPDIASWMFHLLTRFNPCVSMRLMLNENTNLSKKQVRQIAIKICQDEELVNWYIGLVHATTPLSSRRIGLRNDLEQLASIKEYPAQMIKVPTLIIHGLDDADVDVSNAQLIASLVPNAELLILDNVGHMIWLGTHKDKLNNRIGEFLQRNIKT